MKDGLAAPDDLQHFFAALDVERGVLVQKAEYDPVGAVLDEQTGVLEHGLELRFGVAEPALARAHHAHDRQTRRVFFDGQKRAESRRQSAVKEIGIKLHPVRPALPGCNGVCRGAAAGFKRDRIHPVILLNDDGPFWQQPGWSIIDVYLLYRPEA